MGLRRVSHKPLGPTSVLARKGHSNCCSLVRNFIYLATDLVSRAAVPVSAGVAILDNEICYYPVNGDTAKISALGQTDEVINCKRGFVGEQLNSKRTFARSHYSPD